MRRGPAWARGVWWGSVAAVVLAVVVATVSLRQPDAGPLPATAGAWAPMAGAPIEGRAFAASVWTGTEVVVVGGEGPGGQIRRDAAGYNPRSNTWRRLPDAPIAEPPGATAVWTGKEVVIGGSRMVRLAKLQAGYSSWYFGDPIALDPATGAWRTVPHPAEGAVIALAGAAGEVVALIESARRPSVFRLGGDGRSWLPLTMPEVAMDTGHVRDWHGLTVGGRAVFMAGEWIGFYVGPRAPVGFVVDPAAGSVRPIANPPLRAETRQRAVSFVAGIPAGVGDDHMLFLARTIDDRGALRHAVLSYGLRTGHWTESARLKEQPRTEEFFRGLSVTAVGESAIVLGGIAMALDAERDDAGALRLAYDRNEDAWRRLRAEPRVEMARVGHTAVWTGQELVVWGGLHQRQEPSNRADTPAHTGAVYRLPPRR